MSGDVGNRLFSLEQALKPAVRPSMRWLLLTLIFAAAMTIFALMLMLPTPPK